MVTIATNMAGRGTDIILGKEVLALGGLRVIGTERHESRRIDNQLRGRAGRQGDIGSSKFYLSLEDNLIRLFGLEKYIELYRKLGIKENEEITHKTASKQVEKAQRRVELNNYNMRKQLLDYDKVNNDQRELIYAERRKLLNISNNNYQTHAESRGQLQLPVGVSRIRVERKRITYGNLWI